MATAWFPTGLTLQELSIFLDDQRKEPVLIASPSHITFPNATFYGRDLEIETLDGGRNQFLGGTITRISGLVGILGTPLNIENLSLPVATYNAALLKVWDHSDPQALERLFWDIDWHYEGTEGDDWLNWYSFTGDNLLHLSDGGDHFTGGSGRDTVYGGKGYDHLSGGAGDDRLDGGPGGANIDGGDGADRIESDGQGFIYGGSGNDHIHVMSEHGVGAVYGGAGDDVFDSDVAVGLFLGENGADTFQGGFGRDTVRGGAGNDKLYGEDGADSLDGGAGNDSLYGSSGDDRLLGGDGTNRLEGGTGNDRYVVTSGGDTVVELAGGGTDQVDAGVSHTLAAEVEDLRLIRWAIRGSGNEGDNRLTGNTEANSLFGGAGSDDLFGGESLDRLLGGSGNDWLNGGAGSDSLFGGSGNDTYVVGQSGDRVFETATATGTTDAGGTDTVRAGVSWTLGRFVEHLVLTGTAKLNGTGNGLDNRLIGNDGANTLSGGGGADVLEGGKGLDLLRGGADGSVRDVFVFAHRTHSAVGAGRDRIENFVRGVDDIDLDRMDARASTAANEDFTWGGTTAGAHKVWWQATTGGVVLKADVTGDRTADFELFVKGVSALGSGDVLL